MEDKVKKIKDKIKVFLGRISVRFLVWALYRLFNLRQEIRTYKGLQSLILTCRRKCIVQGLGNLPANGSFIVACNHWGTWQLTLVMGTLVYELRRIIHVMVEPRVYNTDKKMSAQWFSWVPITGARTLIRVLKSGGVAVIIPTGADERVLNYARGGATKEEMVARARPGIGLLLKYAPVVPIGFCAPDPGQGKTLINILNFFKALFFNKVLIRIGPALDFTSRELDSHELENATGEVVYNIFSLVDSIKPANSANKPR